MTHIAEALAEYTAIVRGIAQEYDTTTDVEQIRVDHPELTFLDDDEIETILEQAEVIRHR